MSANETTARPDLAVTRVRQSPKFRLAEVKRVTPLSSHLVRVTLGGADLHDFHSASFDDHVKVFFPAPGELRPASPTLGPDGPVFGPGVARPVARDFTPRRYAPAGTATAAELDLEFALHDAGPATEWAARAQAGQYLGIGGPRGSMIIPTHFDWHLLLGDDTALPAIARRLEELPRGVRAIVIVEVEEPTARIEFTTRADADIHWCYRARSETDSGLLSSLRKLPDFPPGEGYVWAAAEAALVRRLRQHVSEDRHIDKSRIRAAAYWKRGAQAVHEVIDD
jgi:NADPH-dependent ferric siderophore reductase